MKNFAAYVRSILRKRKFVLSVLAEEPKGQTNEPQESETEPSNGNGEGEGEPQKKKQKSDPKPSGTVNFEDLIAKARKEERDKLYPEINKLKEKNNSLLLVIQERDNEISDLKKKVSDLEKTNNSLQKELENGTKTNKTVSDLTTKISLLERQLEDLQEQYEQEVNTLKLEAFKKEKIAEAGGEIIPELVTGNSEEEILESIEKAKQRYAEITQKAMQSVQMPTANPSATRIQLGEELTFEQIASMTPQEWAEHRKKLGLK